MSEAKPRTNISGYFKEISRRLKAQVDVLTPIITHPGEMGDNDHLWFADLVRQHMPKRIGVDTGFVVNRDSDKNSAEWFATTRDHRAEDKSISPQTDILLLDVLLNAPLCSEQAFRVCPIEMVLGVIEVTRHLDSNKLATDLAKIQRVRALADPGKKSYRDSSLTAKRPLRPRAYIVGLGGSISFEQIKSQISAIEDPLRPNAILLLDEVLYIRKPFTLGFFRIEEDVLFQFIAMLRYQIERFPIGSTDLGAYLPGVAELLKGDRKKEEGDQDAAAVSVGPCSLSMECTGPVNLAEVPEEELQSFEETNE
jgi:hypothetical protein